MPDTTSRMNPLIVAAAVALIIFSAVGVGVMTGLIPSSLSKSAEVPAPVADAAKNAPAPAQKTTRTAPKQNAASEAPKRTAAQEPRRVATAPPAPPPAAPRVCANCGSVEAVNVVEQKGEGSGLGAVAGGVAGALLGNQVGGGSGRKIATVAGAAGGAYAGHQIEKHVKSTKRYDVIVRMEDGSARTFPYDSEPAFRAGARVKVVEGSLVPN